MRQRSRPARGRKEEREGGGGECGAGNRRSPAAVGYVTPGPAPARDGISAISHSAAEMNLQNHIYFLASSLGPDWRAESLQGGWGGGSGRPPCSQPRRGRRAAQPPRDLRPRRLLRDAGPPANREPHVASRSSERWRAAQRQERRQGRRSATSVRGVRRSAMPRHAPRAFRTRVPRPRSDSVRFLDSEFSVRYFRYAQRRGDTRWGDECTTT